MIAFAHLTCALAGHDWEWLPALLPLEERVLRHEDTDGVADGRLRVDHAFMCCRRCHVFGLPAAVFNRLSNYRPEDQ